MMTKYLRIVLLIIIAAGVGYYAGVTKISMQWDSYKPDIVFAGKEPPPSVQQLDFTMFWQVLDKLESQYYDKNAINAQKLLDGAIQGMVSSLDDPYTVYLPPTQNTDFKQGLAGKFEGIGAELGMTGKQIIIVAPLDGSPSQKAGIRPGDAIIKVDDQMTYGWTVNQAVDKIRGAKGTIVKLTILHKGENQTKDVSITRDTIQVKSVTAWTKKIKDIDEINESTMLKTNGEKKIAYIRLSQFGDTTNQEWATITNSLALEMEKDKDIKGLVLDLRNNPGGYLTDAVFIASEFVKSGAIVMQEDANGNRETLSVSRQGLMLDTPVVVLINKGSASASEIVAGALRDYNRAELVGETSFGKGTIQQAEDLGGGAGVHITVAKWLTPNATWVHKKGLTPDSEVPLDTKDPSHDTQLEKAIESLL